MNHACRQHKVSQAQALVARVKPCRLSADPVRLCVPRSVDDPMQASRSLRPYG